MEVNVTPSSVIVENHFFKLSVNFKPGHAKDTPADQGMNALFIDSELLLKTEQLDPENAFKHYTTITDIGYTNVFFNVENDTICPDGHDGDYNASRFVMALGYGFINSITERLTASGNTLMIPIALRVLEYLDKGFSEHADLINKQLYGILLYISRMFNDDPLKTITWH